MTMKTLLAATAALALLGGTSAFAQNEHQHENQGGRPEGAPHGEARGGPPAGGGAYHPGGGYQQPAPQAARPQGAPQNAPQQNGGPRYGGEQGGYRQNPQYARPQGAPQTAPQYGGQRYQGGRGEGYRGGAGAGFQGRPEGRAGRPNWGAPVGEGGHAPRYDRHYYPRVVDLGARYHWRGEWYPQRGFYYHRWVYGEFLPFGWFAQDYWVTDYWDYGLPPPPYGYAWVRVGADVLLINIATGFVAESVYGAFY